MVDALRLAAFAHVMTGHVAHRVITSSGRRTRFHGASDPLHDGTARKCADSNAGDLARLSYDAANRRTQLTLPNGVAVAYSYDQASRMTGPAYSANGGRLGNLSYDADGRRTSVSGSLAAVSLPAAASGNTFNADNEMTGFNGQKLAYDANGNLTADGTNTYTWDARHHLAAISGSTTASFVYDALGRRMNKTVNGVVTQFVYDGLNPVQELNSSDAATANLLTGLNIDEYFTRTDSNGAMSFLTDALGSTIALANSAGAIATQYTYEPFGNVTASGQTSANPYQFTGRENDATGLYFYRARYYSPTFQRFIAQDPIGFRGGDANLYGYIRQNPTSTVDPFGLLTIQMGIELNFDFGSLNGTFSFGFAFDDQGGVGTFSSEGGGFGLGTPGLSGGLALGYSNAKTICDLAGPFNQVGGSGGAGIGGGVSGFAGASPDGLVTGASLTLGGGFGAGLSDSITTTTVTPSNPQISGPPLGDVPTIPPVP
jgi:RHS repeat-associated protein